MMEVTGTLPVALKKMVGQDTIESKNIVMRQLNVIEYLETQANAAAGQYVAITDLVAMTKLIDDEGNEHDITYEMLGASSRANFDYLNAKKNELDAKEKAES